LRDRKAHLSPDAERLVAAALGLSNSGSRMEDRFWERQLRLRIDRLLDAGHPQSLNDALDRLQHADSEAYAALIESVEEAGEGATIEIGGQALDCFFVSAPMVAWTRFRIPSGPLGAEAARAVAAHWQAHVLAADVRFQMAPHLYSLDQLPRDFPELRRLVRRLGAAAVEGQPVKLDLKALPDSADMLADTRYLIGVVAVPTGQPMFRWQEVEAKDHASRAAWPRAVDRAGASQPRAAAGRLRFRVPAARRLPPQPARVRSPGASLRHPRRGALPHPCAQRQSPPG
jgi:hypothetical protein